MKADLGARTDGNGVCNESRWPAERVLRSARELAEALADRKPELMWSLARLLRRAGWSSEDFAVAMFQDVARRSRRRGVR